MIVALLQGESYCVHAFAHGCCMFVLSVDAALHMHVCVCVCVCVCTQMLSYGVLRATVIYFVGYFSSVG